MKIATDLDDTLCFLQPLPGVLKKRYLTGEERRLKIKLYKESRETAKPNIALIRELKNKEFFIITGRRIRWREITQNWLDKYGIKPMGIFFFDRKEKTRENLIEYKAEIINKLMVDAYYEDDLIINKALKKLCPKTKILNPLNQS